MRAALVHGRREKTPNDPKLSDRSPRARVCAERRKAKARHVPGFMAAAHAVTEPVERKPGTVTERQGCGSLQRMVRRLFAWLMGKCGRGIERCRCVLRRQMTGQYLPTQPVVIPQLPEPRSESSHEAIALANERLAEIDQILLRIGLRPAAQVSLYAKRSVVQPETRTPQQVS